MTRFTPLHQPIAYGLAQPHLDRHGWAVYGVDIRSILGDIFMYLLSHTDDDIVSIL